MGKNLVIVESPAKARTLEKFLGKDFSVLASYGHVRDIPSKKGMVALDRDFEPHYALIPENKRHVDAIKKALKGVDALYLATDDGAGNLDVEPPFAAFKVLDFDLQGRASLFPSVVAKVGVEPTLSCS